MTEHHSGSIAPSGAWLPESGPRGTGAGEVFQRARALFSTAAERKLDLGCLLISIDRLARYDAPVRELLRQALEGLVLTDPEGSAWRVLRSGDHLLVLCPELPLAEAGPLARRLVDGARELRVRTGERKLQLRLSIGLAHTRNRPELDFEILLGVARESLGVAQAAGGDRWVHTELYNLLARRRRSGELEAELAVEVADAFDYEELSTGLEWDEPEPLEEPAAPLHGELEAELQLEPQPSQGLRELWHRLELESEDPFAASLEQRPGQRMEVLERRIAKLMRALEMAEGEIQRLQQEFGSEAGIASVYRSVQGLAPDEPLAELKRRLMRELFRANRALRKTAS